MTQLNNAAKVHTTQVTLIRIFRTWRMEKNKARRCDAKTKEPSKVQRKTTTAESNHQGVTHKKQTDNAETIMKYGVNKTNVMLSFVIPIFYF